MKPIKILIAAMSISLLSAGCAQKNSTASKTPAIPYDKELEEKIENTLAGMTLREKAGQMVQLNVDLVLDLENSLEVDTAKLNTLLRDYKIGSILNCVGGHSQPAAKYAEVITKIQQASMDILGIPCLYGLDQIHGATYYNEGTFFPQEVNIAATFDTVHAENMANAIAYETRAGMVPWVFSPVMDLARDARWPRMWESWGEDPYLSAVMSKVSVTGDQGSDPNHIPLDKVAACPKHYLGYGAPITGKDRTPAWISPLDLRERYFEPFKESIRAGALSVMVNSASINGIPVHASRQLLTLWLKEELNWDGMVISDWADINNLFTREHIAADKVEAHAIAINAGIDMTMDPYDCKSVDYIEEAVERGLVPMERIDDAVRRILRLKYRLGLFESPVWDVSGIELGRKDFREQAYQAALESEVLLKNDGVLPLAKGTRILVTGPNGNSTRTLNGGWSYTWQGAETDGFAEANSIYEALSEKFGKSNVDYVAGVKYVGENWQDEDNTGIQDAVRAARSADVIVACIGENSYCETPGNINDLNLSPNQKQLVRALAGTGKPLVMVLNEGRPRIISDIEPLADAVVHVFLPSRYGGDVLARLLAGEENFSGKMPYTYPKHINSLHTYDYKVSENVSTMEGMYNYDAKMDVQWEFGYGLSYTSFEYSDLKVTESFGADDDIRVSVTVMNTGAMAGKESVLVYSSDLVASVVPDNKRLRDFRKISLAPGESATVEFSIPASRLAFVGADGLWRLEKGDFRIAVGGLHKIVKCNETRIWETANIE